MYSIFLDISHNPSPEPSKWNGLAFWSKKDDQFLHLKAWDPEFPKIKESYFSICPRGYGPTSFRLYESIQMGTVPIYISDKFFLPYIEFLDWSEFAILLFVPVSEPTKSSFANVLTGTFRNGLPM